jgi:hypothetical protein
MIEPADLDEIFERLSAGIPDFIDVDFGPTPDFGPAPDFGSVDVEWEVEL